MTIAIGNLNTKLSSRNIIKFQHTRWHPCTDSRKIKYNVYLTFVIRTCNSIQRLNLFDFCDKNLQFTADTFDNSNIHSLDIKILNNETDIYINNANTCLIISIVILTIEIQKRHWYVHCIINHSNQQLFMTRVNYLKMIMSWNCYQSSVKNKLIKRLQS